MNTNYIFARCVNFFRRFPVRGKQITLIEKLDTGGTGSLFSIRDECERRGYSFSYNLITHADYEVRPGNLFGLIRLFTVKAFRLAVSSHVFLNDNFMPLAYMKLSKDTKVVQLWHGMGSYKRFGGSVPLPPDVYKELKYVNSHVTHILASSEHIRDNYAEAFCVPAEKVLTIGCPQADYYMNALKNGCEKIRRARLRLERAFPALKGKKLALYAPTFRKEAKRDREILSHFDFERFERECGEEYCLGIRLHPQIKNGVVPGSCLDLTDYPNVRELLMMTDLLIADYSSITVEYALLGRPILIYAYDKDWYLKHDRGFYFDFDRTAPGPVIGDMDGLIHAVKDKTWDLKKVEAFARLHNDFFDGKSTERIVDYYWGKDTGAGMKIIAGLGNPTDRYKGTRHNAGYMALDAISREYNIPLNTHKFRAMTGSGFIGGVRVLLMKPLTYMNLSGESIRAAADFYKTEAEDITVIYDDISLDAGMLRIRKKGSAGGHNGMKSIISHLGSEDFSRIRIGIGMEKPSGMDLADYVLGKIPAEDREKIEETFDKVTKAVELIVTDRIDEAMNLYNTGRKKKARKKKAEKPDAQGEKAETPLKAEESDAAGEKAETPTKTAEPDPAGGVE